MVAHLDEKSRVDVFVRQARITIGTTHDRSTFPPETYRPFQLALIREHPVKTIERPFGLCRIVLEGAHDARRHGALRRAVGAMQQEQAVRTPFLYEVVQDPVDLGLDVFLTDQGVALRVPVFEEWQLKQIEACE